MVFMSLLRAKFVTNSHICAKINFFFLKNTKKKFVIPVIKKSQGIKQVIVWKFF